MSHFERYASQLESNALVQQKPPDINLMFHYYNALYEDGYAG